MKSYLLAVVAMLTIGGAAAAANRVNASVAPLPSATSAVLTDVVSFADACGGARYNATLSFVGSVNDGGGADTVWFTIFDEQVVKYQQSFSAPVGLSRSYAIAVEYAGSATPGTPGIGIYVGEAAGTGELIRIDPFLPAATSGCTFGGRAAALSYVPAAGATIAYDSAGSASPIVLGNGGGGSGDGPAATTTLSNCSISGGSSAFATTAFNPGVSMLAAAAPVPAAITLPACLPQAGASSAVLQCIETRGSGNTPTPRAWNLRCPALVAAPTPIIQAPALVAAPTNAGVPDAASRRAVASRNALQVAFASDASNLVSGDSNGRADIFLRDRIAATTTRISALAEPLNPGVLEAYSDPAISADGATIAFSGSSGQVYAAANGVGRRISANAAGVFGNGTSGKPMVAGAGTLVFFESRASNLLTGSDGNGALADILVKDLSSEAVTLISRGPNGEAADGPSAAPYASADGQTIAYTTLASNIVPADAGGVAFSENFDGVSAATLPSAWTASNPISGNGARWSTSTTGSPAPASAPNALLVEAEAVVTDKVLDSPPISVSATPATLSFQRFNSLESGFDGLVLEISINGGAYTDALAAGGTFTAGGYNAAISVNFLSPLAGRSAWSGGTTSYQTTTYQLPGAALVGSSVRFRWRLATDSSTGGGSARIDSIVGSNLRVAATAPASLLPRGVKTGTIQQAVLMRGGGFGQSRFYLSRNRGSGELGNGDSSNVRLTPDGRFGVFESLASNLVGGDSNGVSDIYWFAIANNQLAALERVSQSKTGGQANGASRNPSVSDDGQLIAFETDASNLVQGDSNGASDVVIKHVATGDLVRQTQSLNGQEPNGASMQPLLSGDSSLLVFASLATNLTSNDSNNAADVFAATVISSTPRDEPNALNIPLPTPNPANASCPGGFFVATVTDGPGDGLGAGTFGMELLLDDPGTRLLAGGLNFGGLIDAGQVGFAGFNFANAANENQRLNLSLRGSPGNDAGAILPVRVKIVRQTSATASTTVYDASIQLSMAQASLAAVTVAPGFYVATVAVEGAPANAVGAAPEGQFYFELTTSFVDRPGGGFQGGAVVGGYHATHPLGGVSGYAGFCLATAHRASVHVLAQPSYGSGGAQDLRLRILDAAQQLVIAVPPEQP